MSRQIQFRRGTATEHENFIGAMGEITVDTTNKTIRVHDGTTAGGTMLAKKSDIPSVVTMIPDWNNIITITDYPTNQASRYTASQNCLVVMLVSSAYLSQFYVYINGHQMLCGVGNNSNITQSCQCSFVLATGDTLYIGSNNNKVVFKSMYVIPFV